MRIDSGAEITDVIKETRLFWSRNNELGFVRCAGGLVHGGSKRPPKRLKRIENNIGNRHFRIVPTIDSALHHVAQFANIPGPLISFQRSHCVLRKRSEEHTSELQSLMRIPYSVFYLKKKTY